MKENLQELGLSEGEAEIYLALFKLTNASITQLAKKTGRHRTNIYDTIEKLKEKCLVSESITDNKRVFSAADPENLLNYLKEKEETANEIVQELHQFQKSLKNEIQVETYKGTAGLKSVFRDILREKKDYIGYGEGRRFMVILPIFYEQFRNKLEELGIATRLILKKGIKIPFRKWLQIKYLDYISPSTTFIYGDKVAIVIWQPFPTAIKITDKQVADSYRTYFEVMWKQAKP